jgi:ParB-like chromosome segregation protein Spo0J
VIGLIPTAEALTLMSPDADPEEGTDVADVLDRKRKSPHYPRLLEDIRRDGITIPVVIDHGGLYPELTEGHHRIAAAVDLGLPAVPWSSVPLRIDN